MHEKTCSIFEFKETIFCSRNVSMVFRTSFKSAKLGHVLSTKGTFQICTPQQFLQNILLYLFFGIIGKKSLPEKWMIFLTFPHYFCKIYMYISHIIWKLILKFIENFNKKHQRKIATYKITMTNNEA